MKNNKQTQELTDKIKGIEKTYNVLRCFFLECDWSNENINALDEVLTKAKAWDIFKAKCGKGGKVASKNLSKKERIERARKASRSRGRIQGKKKGRRTTKKSSI